MTRGSGQVPLLAPMAVLFVLILPAGVAIGGATATTPAPEAGAVQGGGGGGGTGPDCSGGEVHDDGSAENGYGWSSASSAEGRLVEKFTPPSYPWSYERVCIGWTRNGIDSSIDYRIVVYDDDGPGGEPGTMLASVPVTDSGVPVWTSTAIYSHDVQGRVPVIHSGSVYIGATWSAMAQQQFYLTADETPASPVSGGYGWVDTDGAWRTIEYWHPDYRAMFIRADGRAGDALVDCPPGGGSDDIARGFYVPSYGGHTLDQVDLRLTTTVSGTYTVRMTARTGAYGGPLVGIVDLPVALDGSFTPVSFLFGGAPTVPFETLTFSMSVVSGPGGYVGYDIGPCSFGGCTSCHNIIETNDTSPPLSSFRRRSIGVSIYGRAAVVFSDAFESACVAPWSSSLNYTPASWSCPPGSAAEGEACPVNGTDPDLDPNGGCNSVPPSFGVIALGGTVCGTTGTYVTSSLDYRDTDWYSFTVPADGYFRIAGGGEQDLQLFAIDRTNCGAPAILGGVIAEAGCRGSFVAWLEAGTHSVFVAPTVYSGLPCAPATRDYWVSIEPAPEP